MKYLIKVPTTTQPLEWTELHTPGVDKMIILGTVESISISNHAASILAIGRFLLVTHPPATTSTSATTPTTTDQRKPSTHANHPSTNPAILFHSHPLRLLHCPEKSQNLPSPSLARPPQRCRH
ncbi:uncharacterized protein BDCG_01753 [Blastomyces dermatitidis ER-3]|uniref:Uncharacterized protein n=1 Tax=Ajellomyces dermatitidis (strain ER-3 / ATCC MYA-2586) TaxID=559297 RepID=A0ABP2ESC5_AJEDR|nr:uncharacterized protein BDCG_01753 [Blastomyces dermatitidis ER-3]EEQ86633.2 hypothetical protein BDCG_01753 [Blastomyces dermatitidis ER-3]